MVPVEGYSVTLIFFFPPSNEAVPTLSPVGVTRLST